MKRPHRKGAKPPQYIPAKSSPRAVATRAGVQNATAALRDCFAIATPGFEAVVAEELRALGIDSARAEEGGVAFRADDRGLFAANLHLRAASRVLVRVAVFTAKSFAELERRAKPIVWKPYVPARSRVTFRVTCKKSRLYHSDAVAQRLEKALLAAVPGIEVGRATTDDSDEGDAASQLIIVRFAHDVCTISADTSGELLHRRGYRLATAKAPIRETIAAGCLLALGYDGAIPLLDPMCGSGTFAIEAALIARNIAPGSKRRFACESWPGFDSASVKRVRAEATAAERPSGAAPIHASDRDAGAVKATRANAERAGVAGDMTIVECALSAIEPPAGRGLCIANPPYGTRVGERDALRNLYAQFGNVMRAKLPGWRVALVSAERSLEAQTKLPFEEALKFSNGGIKVRLIATPAAARRTEHVAPTR